MAANFDIVGGAAVDVVPIVPNFHRNLRSAVLPIADRVGLEAGQKLGERIAEGMRASLAGEGQRIGAALGDAISDGVRRQVSNALPDAVRAGGRRASASATQEGGQVGGAFANSIKRRLEIAFRSLPRADVRLGDTGFNADMDRLRARIQTLAGKTVGIDIDAGAALAEITAIDAALVRLAADNPTVNVRSDTAATRAALADIQRQINDVDNDDVNVRVRADTGQARAELIQLGILLGAVAAIPVVPVAAAGIGAIASAVVAAGAGIGALALVAVPAIKGVTEAIRAKESAEKSAASATGDAAAANVRAAQSAISLANAQASLASAHRQATQAVADANRQVADAERALTDAKRAARDAENDLTAARRDARQELRSLQDQLLDGMLSERQATLRVLEAQEELARVAADPKSTELQRQRAQLSVDEALRNADKQKAKQAELRKSVDDATKAGVDGNKAVQSAAQRVADANRSVEDRTRAVANAQSKVRAAEIQGAESIASAERGLRAARLSSVDMTVKATGAADEYRKTLAKLTPEQRDLFESVAGPKGLTAAFSDWARSLSPDVLPLFTRMVDGAKSALPGISPLVRETAAGMSELQDAASRELKNPFWQGFKKSIETSAQPAVIGLGKTIGNVLKGAAGVVDAFLPHIDSIADRMVKSSGRFADWGTNLKGSPEFEKFLDYSDEHGPQVAALFGAIASAVLEIGKALSPVSGPVLAFLTGTAEGIATVAENTPWLVSGIWLAVTAWKAWTVAIWLWDAALAASGVTLVIAGIAALAAAVIYAWNTFPGFRRVVIETWDAIRSATVFLWENYLQPFFSWLGGIVVWLWNVIIKPYVNFMIAYWRLVGSVIVWLWKNIFSPIFGFIGALIAWWWKNIVQRYFGYVMSTVTSVGNSFKWLYEKGIKPPIDLITGYLKTGYEKGIKPVFDALKSAVKLVGEAFGTAYTAIRKHWGLIAQAAAKPVNFVIEWVYNRGIKAVFDGVSKYVGMDPLPKGPKLLDETPRFAEGGRTSGGVPGKDSIPALLMADEFVIKRSSARSIGYDALAYMNSTGEIPRFAGGGIVGTLGGAWDWTKEKVGNAVSKGIDWAKTAADLIANPSKIWAKLIKPVVDKVKEKLSGFPLAGTLAKIPGKMISGIRDKIVDAVSFSGAGDGGDGGGGNGQWAKPVNAAYGTRFGVAGSMWSSGHHTGLDFPAPVGTAIRAVADGVVSSVAGSGPYGNHVMINHGGGLSSLYAHMSRILTTLNAHVTRGQKIGEVGATGNTTGPHLHLEARQNGRAVDPVKWFDQGGYLPTGLSLVANGTGSPEPVFTSAQFADIRAAKNGGGLTEVHADVRVFVGDREITDIVRTEINTYDQQSATALTTGRY